MKENRIYFVDVTNRDGVQTSRLGLAKLEKTIINLMLDNMGITQSEFGFPTTKHEINYLNGNLELVERGAIRKTKLSGWMRGIASDVELSFNNAEFYELYGRVFAKFEATVTNVSDRIFIDCHWTDPRVVMRFNKDYVLTARIFGSNVSYDNPWKPGEKRTISIFCDRPEDEYITVGFKDFFPKLSLLLFDITVEDSDGEKTTMPFTYDIRTCWDAYVNKSESEQTQQSEQQEQPKEKAVLEF